MVGGGVAGIELKGAAELLLGSAPIPVLSGFDVRERSVGFDGVFVQQHSPACVGGRLGPDLDWRDDAVVTKELVGVGQTGVGLRVLRVFGDDALKETDGELQALFGALIEMVAALLIEVVGGEVLGLQFGSCSPAIL